MDGNPFVCVTTDAVEPDLNWEQEHYAEAGVDYRIHTLRQASPQAIIKAASMAHVLVVDQAKITSEVIQGLTQCRLIIRHGDGFDNLDVEAARRHGILCANEPGFWSKEAAEQAFALGMALALRLPLQEKVARRPTGTGSGWNLQHIMPYSGLASQTVGLLGCGKIGQHALSLYKAVAHRVLVHDPGLTPGEIQALGATPVSFDQLLIQSDILSIHVPATQGTIGLFNAQTLGHMKKGAILINTARGSIVDTEALVHALESGHLGGAGLDSTLPEPLPENHRLFHCSNVIITPHMAWYSEDALARIRKQIVTDVLACKRGELPAHPLNPDVLETPQSRWKKA